VIISSEMVVLMDEQAKITLASPMLRALLGMTSTQIANCRVQDLVTPDDVNFAQQFCRDLSEDPALTGPVEWRLRTSAEQLFAVEVTGANLIGIPPVNGIVLYMRAITPLK
jgi:PAS domain S-box-containing protein